MVTEFLYQLKPESQRRYNRDVVRVPEKEGEKQGFELIQVKAWDYPALQDAYTKAEHFARTERVPVIIHVIEVTQPQGHSTSGSHERYKSAERLQWEQEHDGLKNSVSGS